MVYTDLPFQSIHYSNPCGPIPFSQLQMRSKSCPLEANYADLVMTSLLQVVLLGAAPLLEIDEVGVQHATGRSTEPLLSSGQGPHLLDFT